MSKQTRREFLKTVGFVAGSAAASSLFVSCATVTPETAALETAAKRKSAIVAESFEIIVDMENSFVVE